VTGEQGARVTEFFLRRASLGSQYLVHIDEQRYHTLAQARRTLIDAGAFEQHYEILLGNFNAYEMFCANASLQSSIEFSFRYETWARLLAEANRHALNFLTTSKLYADQVVRGFKHVVLEQPFSEVAKRRLNDAYDATLAYRFVCELRNHVQHRGYAVHGSRSGIGNTWLDNSSLQFHKARIEEDRGKFKQRVLDQLDDKVDVLGMFRDYVVAVSNVHIELRKVIAAACETARADIKVAMDEFSEAQKDERGRGNPAIGLTACAKEDGEWTRAVGLMLDWDDVRVELSKKNGHRIRLPKPKSPLGPTQAN